MQPAVSSSIDSSALLQQYMTKQQAATEADKATRNVDKSVAGVTGDFNTFLKILTTQLQNQDPTSASDPNEFTKELIQFSGIEQQINSNKKLDQIISLFSSNGITPYLNYVGHVVEAPANGKLVVQDGAADLAYTLPSAAQKVKIEVLDSAGKVVATLEGSGNLGTNRLHWDGSLGGGQKIADGTYTLRTLATDASGKAVAMNDLRLIGKVTGLQTGANNTATLLVGGVSVKDSDVGAVYLSAASTPAGTAVTGG